VSSNHHLQERYAELIRYYEDREEKREEKFYQRLAKVEKMWHERCEKKNKEVFKKTVQIGDLKVWFSHCDSSPFAKWFIDRG